MIPVGAQVFEIVSAEQDGSDQQAEGIAVELTATFPAFDDLADEDIIQLAVEVARVWEVDLRHVECVVSLSSNTERTYHLVEFVPEPAALRRWGLVITEVQ